MGTEHERTTGIHVAPTAPRAKDIANGVDNHRQSRRLQPGDKQIAPQLVFIRCRQARQLSSRVSPSIAKLSQAEKESFAVNRESGEARGDGSSISHLPRISQ